MRKLHFVGACLLTGAFFVGCGSDKSSPAASPGKPDAGTPDTGAPAPVNDWYEGDAGVRDCTAAKWPGVSDACWSCLCGACPEKLNACDTTCVSLLECAITNQTFGNSSPDITCEALLTAKTCVKTNKQGVQSIPLTLLDGCLITSPAKKTGEFRTCDTECGIHYPGDICARNNADAGK